MKSDIPELGLKASLLPSVHFKEFLIQDNKLIFTLENNLEMKNDLNTLYSFEALLLTAKEFGLSAIVIENPPIKQLGPFDLTKETKVPVAANFKTTP